MIAIVPLAFLFYDTDNRLLHAARPRHSTGECFLEILDMLGNDRLRSRDLLPPKSKGLLRDGMQGVHVVEINTAKLIDRRIDISRNGDINDEQGAIDSLTKNRFQKVSRDEKGFGRRRSNQNVNLTALFEPLIERNGQPSNRAGQLMSTFDRSITHAQVRDTARDKRAHRPFAGFAGAEHEDLPISEVAEYLSGQIDRDRSD